MLSTVGGGAEGSAQAHGHKHLVRVRVRVRARARVRARVRARARARAIGLGPGLGLGFAKATSTAGQPRRQARPKWRAASGKKACPKKASLERVSSGQQACKGMLARGVESGV